MKKILLIIVLIIFPVNLAFSIDGNELLIKVDKNLQPEAYEMYRKIINIEPDGKQKEFVLFAVKKGRDKIVSLFLEPASEKGRATLRLGDNMWLYIPNVGKPIRITSLQSVVGGVFNNADIMRLDYHVEYDCETVEEIKEGYLLTLKAKTNTVAYENIKMWVKKDALVPTKIECYAASKMLIKTLYFKKIKDFGENIIRPSIVETDSPLYKGYKSIMIFAGVKKRELPDEVFTLNYLPKVKDLR